MQNKLISEIDKSSEPIKDISVFFVLYTLKLNELEEIGDLYT